MRVRNPTGEVRWPVRLSVEGERGEQRAGLQLPARWGASVCVFQNVLPHVGSVRGAARIGQSQISRGFAGIGLAAYGATSVFGPRALFLKRSCFTLYLAVAPSLIPSSSGVGQQLAWTSPDAVRRFKNFLEQAIEREGRSERYGP